MNISHEEDEYCTHWDYGNSLKEHLFFAGKKKQTTEHSTPAEIGGQWGSTLYQRDVGKEKEKKKAERNPIGEISEKKIAEPFPFGPEWLFLLELEAYESLWLGHGSDQTNHKKMIPANSLKTIEQRGLENVNYQKRIKEAKELEEKRITEVKEREAERMEEMKKRKAKQIEEAKEREAKRIEKAKQREAKRIEEAIEMERKRMHLLASLGTHKPTQKQLSILNPIVITPNTKAIGKVPVKMPTKKELAEKIAKAEKNREGKVKYTAQNTLQGSLVKPQRSLPGYNPNLANKRKRNEVKKSDENKENISVSKKAKKLMEYSQEKMPLDKNQCPICKKRFNVDKAEFQRHIFSCYKTDQISK